MLSDIKLYFIFILVYFYRFLRFEMIASLWTNRLWLVIDWIFAPEWKWDVVFTRSLRSCSLVRFVFSICTSLYVRVLWLFRVHVNFKTTFSFSINSCFFILAWYHRVSALFELLLAFLNAEILILVFHSEIDAQMIHLVVNGEVQGSVPWSF